MIKLTRLISDGMVIHKDKPFKVWGKATPGSRVCAELRGSDSATVSTDISWDDDPAVSDAITDNDGSFKIIIEPPAVGKGYELVVTEYSVNGTIDDTRMIHDVAVGLVYIMCGQSNAGFPMIRVKDTEPDEWNEPDNDDIRTFKITEHYAFGYTEEDVLTGEWKGVNKKTLDDWCAVGYYTAKTLHEKTDLSVGIIDATFGGATIEAWMSEEWLEGYGDRLDEAGSYKDAEYVKRIEDDNLSLGTGWRVALYNNDTGVINRWERMPVSKPGELSECMAGWDNITLPAYLWDTEIGHTIGSIWFRRLIFIGDRQAYLTFVSESGLDKSHVVLCEDKDIIDMPSHLWLGTMTDADITYVNGAEVGRTEYSYPPRRYEIPKGTLREGLNVVTIRLTVEHGLGRVTPHKMLSLFTGDVCRYIDSDDNEQVTGVKYKTDLSGVWYYRIGATAEEIPPYTFLCWKPTALYNGVLAPCLNYSIGAFLWYQGESNTDASCEEYYDLSVRQIEGLRKACGDERLPYVYARLPRFDLNIYEGGSGGVKDGWQRIQLVQDALGKLPDVYEVDSRGLGEAYDLHPQDKKPLGERFADILTGLCEK